MFVFVFVFVFLCQRVQCTKFAKRSISELLWFPRSPVKLFGETTLVLGNSLPYVRPAESWTEDRRLFHSDARCVGCTGLLTSDSNCIHQVINVFYKFQFVKCEAAIYLWSLCWVLDTCTSRCTDVHIDHIWSWTLTVCWCFHEFFDHMATSFVLREARFISFLTNLCHCHWSICIFIEMQCSQTSSELANESIWVEFVLHWGARRHFSLPCDWYGINRNSALTHCLW